MRWSQWMKTPPCRCSSPEISATLSLLTPPKVDPPVTSDAAKATAISARKMKLMARPILDSKNERKKLIMNKSANKPREWRWCRKTRASFRGLSRTLQPCGQPYGQPCGRRSRSMAGKAQCDLLAAPLNDAIKHREPRSVTQHKSYIVGNWKMNGRLADVAILKAIADAAGADDGVDVGICPPATLIGAFAAQAGGIGHRRAGLPRRSIRRAHRLPFCCDDPGSGRKLFHRRPFRTPRRSGRNQCGCRRQGAGASRCRHGRDPVRR